MKNYYHLAKKILGLNEKQILERIDVIRDRYTDENVTEHAKFDLLFEAMMLANVLMKFAKNGIEYDTVVGYLAEVNRNFKMNDDKDRPAPNRYHTDGDGGHYDDFGTGLGGQPKKPNINTDACIQVPRGDDMKYWQDEYGLRIWKNIKDSRIAQRGYYWCDRVIITNENHRVLDDMTFTKFIRDIYGDDDWVAELPKKDPLVWVGVLDDNADFVPGIYRLSDIYTGEDALPWFYTKEKCQKWCDDRNA